MLPNSDTYILLYGFQNFFTYGITFNPFNNFISPLLTEIGIRVRDLESYTFETEENFLNQPYLGSSSSTASV